MRERERERERERGEREGERERERERERDYNIERVQYYLQRTERAENISPENIVVPQLLSALSCRWDSH